MNLSDKIKTLRLKNAFTLRALAKKVGVTASTVQRWESGEIQNLRRDKIKALSDALKTSPSYLMGWEDEDDLKASKLSDINKKVSDMIELSDYLKEKGFEFEILETKVKVKKGDKSAFLELEVLNEYFKDGFKNIENLLNGLLDK